MKLILNNYNLNSAKSTDSVNIKNNSLTISHQNVYSNQGNNIYFCHLYP